MASALGSSHASRDVTKQPTSFRVGCGCGLQTQVPGWTTHKEGYFKPFCVRLTVAVHVTFSPTLPLPHPDHLMLCSRPFQNLGLKTVTALALRTNPPSACVGMDSWSPFPLPGLGSLSQPPLLMASVTGWHGSSCLCVGSLHCRRQLPAHLSAQVLRESQEREVLPLRV